MAKAKPTPYEVLVKQMERLRRELDSYQQLQKLVDDGHYQVTLKRDERKGVVCILSKLLKGSWPPDKNIQGVAHSTHESVKAAMGQIP